jgi:hypothetical protein
VLLMVANGDNDVTVDLDGTSSIFAGNVAVYQGTELKPYVPTTTVAVTHDTDADTIPGSNLSTVGTIMCEVSSRWASAPTNLAAVAREATARLIGLGAAGAAGVIWASAPGSGTSASPSGTDYQDSPQVVATTFGDSGLIAHSAGALSPDLTPGNYAGSAGTGAIGIGTLNTGSQAWEGNIRRIRIYPTQLTANQLAQEKVKHYD